MNSRSKQVGTWQYLHHILIKRTIIKYIIICSLLISGGGIIWNGIMDNEQAVMFFMVITIFLFFCSFVLDTIKLFEKDITDEDRYKEILYFFINNNYHNFMLSESLAILMRYMNPNNMRAETPQYVKSNASRLYSIISNGIGGVNLSVYKNSSYFRELCKIFLDLLDKKVDQEIFFSSDIRTASELLNIVEKKKKKYNKKLTAGDKITFSILLIIVLVKFVVFLFNIDISSYKILDLFYNIGSDIFAFVLFVIGIIVKIVRK